MRLDKKKYIEKPKNTEPRPRRTLGQKKIHLENGDSESNPLDITDLEDRQIDDAKFYVEPVGSARAKEPFSRLC